MKLFSGQEGVNEDSCIYLFSADSFDHCFRMLFSQETVYKAGSC